MTTFDNREQAFENKYAHDQEMNFRITARLNRLAGQWAAEKMRLTPAETDSYAKSVVQAEFEELGDEDVVRKLLGDLLASGADASEIEVRAALERFAAEARHQLMDPQ